MEALDPVAELIVYASQVTISWDDVTEYLFYGLVTVSIWLIIKVFIEISETRGRPKNSVLGEVNTRRRLSEEPVETISEISTKGDGDRIRSTTKGGAKVRFDLSKNKGYVIEDDLPKGVIRDEDGAEKKGERVEADEYRRVVIVEETDEELNEEFEKKTDEEIVGPISQDVVGREFEITEVEEDEESESNFCTEIEEVIIEDLKMKECDAAVEIKGHEREEMVSETPEDDDIGDVSNERAGNKEMIQEFDRKIEKVLEDFTLTVTKGIHEKETKEVDKNNRVQVMADAGKGNAEICEKEIKHETCTEWNEEKKVLDESVEEKNVLVLENEMEERHQNGYTEKLSEEGKEMCVKKESQGTESIEVKAFQREDMEVLSKIGNEDGQEKVVNETGNGTEGADYRTEVTGKENTVLNTATAEVPYWCGTVYLATCVSKVKDAAGFSMTKSLVKKFESLRESNFERAEYVPFKTGRIRRHLSMPSVKEIGSVRYGGHFDKKVTARNENPGEQDSTESRDVAGEEICEKGSFKDVDVESMFLKVSPTERDETDANKAPRYGVRVTRSKSLRDWKEDLKQSYKAGKWRVAKGLPFCERFEDPDREKLIQETFGTILKPTLCLRESAADVINRSYSAEERNLLKNNCGQNGLSDWFSKFRLQDWKVGEDEEENSEFPRDREGNLADEFDGNLSFFEATARNSRMEQEVDLISEGFSADFLDKEQPHILVSEWVKVQEHCKSTYELRVKLLDKNKEIISDYKKDLSFDDSSKVKWEKVSHVFKEYGPGVRYILFNHGAVKWSGMGGCRISGAVVRILNPT